MISNVLADLDALLQARRNADADESYVASLHQKGLDKILEKVGEEATETLIAAKNVDTAGTDAVVHETADLWFHSLVMLSHLDLDYRDVLRELDRRLNRSGLAEKAARRDGSDN